jgi:hypothetical protein
MVFFLSCNWCVNFVENSWVAKEANGMVFIVDTNSNKFFSSNKIFFCSHRSALASKYNPLYNNFFVIYIFQMLPTPY